MMLRRVVAITTLATNLGQEANSMARTAVVTAVGIAAVRMATLAAKPVRLKKGTSR